MKIINDERSRQTFSDNSFNLAYVTAVSGGEILDERAARFLDDLLDASCLPRTGLALDHDGLTRSANIQEYIIEIGRRHESKLRNPLCNKYFFKQPLHYLRTLENSMDLQVYRGLGKAGAVKQNCSTAGRFATYSETVRISHADTKSRSGKGR